MRRKENDGSLKYLYDRYGYDHEYLNPDKKWAFSRIHLLPIMRLLKAQVLKHGTDDMTKDEMHIVYVILSNIPEMKIKLIELGLTR